MKFGENENSVNRNNCSLDKPRYSYDGELKPHFTTVTDSYSLLLFEPPHDKTNKMACAPSEDSDQPGHPPSLLRVFTVRILGS